MKTNLEKYAAEMSLKIKESGDPSLYHWSELSTVIDELLKYADFSNQSGNEELKFVGYTNGMQILYMSELEGEGAVYNDTKNNCYIPLYMLRSHLHRIESTSGGSVTAKGLGMDDQ